MLLKGSADAHGNWATDALTAETARNCELRVMR